MSPPGPRGFFIFRWMQRSRQAVGIVSGPSPADLAGNRRTSRGGETPAEPRPAGEPITGAQSLVRSLEAAGVEVFFGIPGGAILPAYDPLLDSTAVRHILVRHEQGAGHAAQGYAV